MEEGWAYLSAADKAKRSPELSVTPHAKLVTTELVPSAGSLAPLGNRTVAVHCA